jgi:hypothetical protein
MAALGNARSNERTRVAVEDRKHKLLELLRANDDEDPLHLMGEGSDSLGTLLESIRSNIGRRQRNVVYSAWRHYFLVGGEDSLRGGNALLVDCQEAGS